jgi:hypothetical protein
LSAIAGTRAINALLPKVTAHLSFKTKKHPLAEDAFYLLVD